MKNKSVWTKFGTILRFGNVKREKMENGWKFYSVEWLDDDAREEADAWRSWLQRSENPEDFVKKWYRVDEVNVFQPEETIETLRRL